MSFCRAEWVCEAPLGRVRFFSFAILGPRCLRFSKLGAGAFGGRRQAAKIPKRAGLRGVGFRSRSNRLGVGSRSALADCFSSSTGLCRLPARPTLLRAGRPPPCPFSHCLGPSSFSNRLGMRQAFRFSVSHFRALRRPDFGRSDSKLGAQGALGRAGVLRLRPFLSLIRLRLAPLFFVKPGPDLRRPLNRRGPTQPSLLFPSPTAPRIAAAEAQAPTIFPTKTNMCRRGRRAVVGSFFAAIRACARRRRRAGRTPLGPARLRAGFETQKKKGKYARSVDASPAEVVCAGVEKTKEKLSSGL